MTGWKRGIGKTENRKTIIFLHCKIHTQPFQDIKKNSHTQGRWWLSG